MSLPHRNTSGVEVPSDLVVVGYISGAYGLQGWVRIRPYSAEADALLHAKTWWLGNPELPQQLRDIDMMQAKNHSGDVVARLVGISDRDVAEALKGSVVQISRRHFPALSKDEYYWVDLIGLQVENLQGQSIGIVDSLMDNGAHPILKVSAPADKPEDAPKEILIPFVDMSAKKITVDWGLDF